MLGLTSFASVSWGRDGCVAVFAGSSVFAWAEAGRGALGGLPAATGIAAGGAGRVGEGAGLTGVVGGVAVIVGTIVGAATEAADPGDGQRCPWYWI